MCRERSGRRYTEVIQEVTLEEWDWESGGEISFTCCLYFCRTRLYTCIPGIIFKNSKRKEM